MHPLGQEGPGGEARGQEGGVGGLQVVDEQDGQEQEQERGQSTGEDDGTLKELYTSETTLAK